jgi:LPS sulfotransferase NodH
MGWKEPVNSVLTRTIGYQLARPPGHRARVLPPPVTSRMLVRPVFIFSPARSGSTLLRAILGSHTQMYAPPELPLMHMDVRAETKWIQKSMAALQLTKEDLDHMLWDRVLADTLTRSGKQVIVIKTPSNVLIWSRIAEVWTDARFIFLLRHPAAVVASLQASWDANWQAAGTGSPEKVTASALRYMRKVEEARHELAGHTVRYEDLTTDPEATVSQLCAFLAVPFQPAMLDYGQFADLRISPGLGDASKNIRSGRIQPGTPPPRSEEISPALARMCATWGYRQPDGQPYQATGSPEWDAAGQPGPDDEAPEKMADANLGAAEAQYEQQPSDQH